MTRVGFVGIGKLGSDCAEVMAEHYDLVGYDIVERHPKNFPMVDSLEEAVKDKDFVFVAVQTPHDPEYGGEKPTTHLPKRDFDYTVVEDCLRDINQYLTKRTLVVLISTTSPGTVRKRLAPLITKGRFIYDPYLIAMGSTKWDMVNPEMVIIGTEDGSETGDAKLLIDFYEEFMRNDPRYVVGTWDEMESVKIFYNVFISAKLSLVNMIQDVAERGGNINVDVVTRALAGSTQRIVSSAYMKSGLGDGGSCHPRDLVMLSKLSEDLDLGYDLFGSIAFSREKQAENLAKFLVQFDLPIVILGSSYKPGVEYLDGSYSLLIGHYLKEINGEFCYDEEPEDDRKYTYLLAHRGCYFDYPFKSGSVVVDPWREFKTERQDISVVQYGNTRKERVLLDGREI